MTTLRTPVHAAAVPFAPAVRWNMRSHLLMVDAVALATICALYAIATAVPMFDGRSLVFGVHDLAILATFAIGAIGVLTACDCYDARRVRALRLDLNLVLPATLGGGALALATALVVKFGVEPEHGIASQLLVAGLVSMTATLVLARVGTHAARGWHPKAMRTTERVLVLGDGTRAEELIAQLERAGAGSAGPPDRIEASADLVAFEQELLAHLDESPPTSIVLAFDHADADLQAIVLREGVRRDVPVRVLEAGGDPGAAALVANGIAPDHAFVGARERHWQWHIKLLLDRVFAAVLLCVLSPVFLVVAITIRASDRGPVFYRQPRIGMYGRTFGVWKFRSMRTDADEALADHLASDPDARAEWDAYQKLGDDPRIIRIGNFIRKWSIDELPQLFNVLCGQMSFVGPRPPMVGQLDSYGARFVFAHARPGITGLWQVSGRNELTFDERVALDVQYVTEWSLWQDLKVLARTVPVVALKRGAG